MKVRDRMSQNPVTVGPDLSVDEALGTMRKHQVRHLPVADQGRLVGLVTDIELRTAWFASLLDELTVKDLMVTDPPTIDADANVYQAARILYQNKLTGLLVVEGEVLVGIITLADILRIFVECMGLLGETVSLDVAPSQGQDSLEEVQNLIRSHGGKLVSMAMVPDSSQRRIYSMRMEKTDLEPIAAALRQAGHEVFA
ncbi:MAG: CBS domain-containing protein [Desulfarculaceae bacterium]